MSSPPDASLLGLLLDRHGGALALYASQWTADADDCVQEALVELARLPVVPESPVAWLYRVVKRRALNASRGDRRRRGREQESLRRRLQSAASQDPSEAVALVDLLDQLDEQQRETVVLRLWGGLTLAQIGQALSVSTATAQRRYEQAITQLREAWSPPCPEISQSQTTRRPTG